MNAPCPICDASVSLAADVEVSEVLTCPDCSSSIVVESMQNDSATLAEAPKMEEDWGQ